MSNLIDFFSEQLEEASPALSTAYAIVCILIVIMAVVCLVLEINVWRKYSKANKTGIRSQMSGLDACRYVLDQSGHKDIKVIKAGFLREAVFGNYYNIATKTIYLRSVLGKIDSKKTVTSTAMGVQKAAVARLCEEGDVQARTRNKLSLLGIFGPILFLPVVLIGFLLDVYLLNSTGILSLVSIALGGILLLAGFLVTMLNIPVEKRANSLALKMIEEYGLADSNEMSMMKEVFDAYILSYIANFILEVLRVIQWILEIVARTKNSSKK